MADTLGAWNSQHYTEKLECYYTGWGVGGGGGLGSERFFSGFQPSYYRTALLHPLESPSAIEVDMLFPIQ